MVAPIVQCLIIAVALTASLSSSSSPAAASASGGGETESRIVRLSEDRRIGQLLGLQGITRNVNDPLTGESIREIDDTFLYYSIASFLAAKHFNERSGTVLPQLPELLEGCDFYWGYE